MVKKALSLWLGCVLLAASTPGNAGGVELSLSVQDSGGQPVADAVVFIYDSRGKKYKAPREPYIMDQQNKEFVPRVLPVPVGAKVRFPNSDAIQHHLYSFSSSKSFELPLYAGEPAEPLTFEKTGTVMVGCNIHDWMEGYIVVLPTPYFAVTDARGLARLKVPAGHGRTLAVFHERLQGSVDETLQKIPAGKQPLAKIRWRLTLKPAPAKKRSLMGPK